MINGFINLNKGSGYSSNKCLFSVKKALRLNGIKEKVGHLGTLDPLASGVLPVAIGRATRLFDFSLNKEKTYIAEFTFGYTSSTLDAGSEKIFVSDTTVTEEMLLSILPTFIGKQNQIPPIFSAKSINGVRAYQLARKGQEIELNPKQIEIFKLELLNQIERNIFRFLITCSSGTYIRSIARDMGDKLRCGAYMSNLCRTQSGVFSIEKSVTEEEIIENFSHLEDYILPMDYILKDISSVTLSETETKKICNGIKLQGYSMTDLTKIYGNTGELIGLGQNENNEGLYIKTRLL